MIERLLAGAGSLDQAALTDDEKTLFDDMIERLSLQRAYQRELTDLLADWKDEFLDGVKVAKNRLNLNFGGVAPGGSQFGGSFVRAKVFGYSTWDLSITATGWQDVWGSSASPITMPDTTSNKALIAIPALLSCSPSPKFMELWVSVSGTNYPIEVVKPYFQVGNIYLAILQGAILVGPGDSFYMRGNADKTGNEVLEPFGIQYSPAAYMRTE